MFVPSGYILIREALDRIGQELFPSEWTGAERKARSDLISEDEWLRIKDLPPARGGGALGSEASWGGMTRSPVNPVKLPKDPSEPAYQQEYRARKRYDHARDRLRGMLEAGQLDGAVLDVFTGHLHPVPPSLWRRADAARMIERGEGPIPRSLNTGSLLVQRFEEADSPTKPLPRAKISEVIKLLKEKTATESLTRAQQKDFLRRSFPGFRITEQQFSEIFQSVKAPIGRPPKSRKKV
jgi:hypothetical protein